MMSPPGFDDNGSEETPLLRVQCNNPPSKPTPLPTIQILVLLFPWIVESIVDSSISPYLNQVRWPFEQFVTKCMLNRIQLVRDLPVVGGDGRKVGYYTGIITSLHYAVEAVTTLHWNRLSDQIGRKPILLFCLTGSTISIILFGLCHSFWAIVLSRCLHGALKGNIGVVKTVMAELTDETNVARGFSLLPMTWAIGFVIGPFIGGVLSQPQARWPELFSHALWAEYPYFLPCLVVAACGWVSFVITAVFLKETMICTPSSTPQEELNDYLHGESPKDPQKPLPLRSVLTRPVQISIANYAMIALLGTASLTLIPLIWSTPVEFGGLNLKPASIGLWMSIFGWMDGLFQFAVFPHAVGRFGPRGVFIISIAACAVVFVMFPLENLVVRHTAAGGTNVTIWLLILLQLSSLGIRSMGFSESFFFFFGISLLGSTVT
ncbi:major facilitator superfamily domain-containing protein [Russula compacta]|nr:major facilitator superfamily domain-containing protein [Russula compacta]